MPFDAASCKPSFSDVLDALERQGFNPKKQGKGWLSRCPGHDDHKPSLSIDEAADGGALLHCFAAGCEYQSIIRQLGLWVEPKGNDVDPYHIRKGIKVHHPASLKRKGLFIPFNNGSNQTIYPDGRKINNKETKQAWFMFSDNATDIEKTDSLLVATGYSTTASIYESTNIVSIMVVSDNTMSTVIPILRTQYPDKTITICADHDAKSKFIDLASQHRCKLCHAPMLNGNAKSDFNDLMIANGKQAVCDVISNAQVVTNANPVKSTRFIMCSDFCKQPEQSNSLIRGILDYDSLSAWFGDSEAGKSFLALDRALHIAHGVKWRGRKTNKGMVLYLIGEGKAGMVKRVKAWHEYHAMTMSDNIAFSVIPAALCQIDKVNELIADIQSFISQLGRKPDLIELDTLNKHFGQGDENSTKDMTAFVAGMDELRKATGAAVSTVHHCSLNAKDRARGSIVLHNSIDFEFKVTKSGNAFSDWVTTMEVTKIKDYERPQPMAWKWGLQPLPWADEDDDGNAIPANSVVMLPTDYLASDVGDKQSEALSILKTLYAQQQKNLVDAGHAADGALVATSDWSQGMTHLDRDKGNRSRIRASLIKRGLVVECGGGYVKPA